MNDSGYENAFQRYEAARAAYARLQEEIRSFLAKFTGNPSAAEQPFILRDLARMEGLRAQRDEALTRYRMLEEAIFNRLGNAWSNPQSSNGQAGQDQTSL